MYLLSAFWVLGLGIGIKMVKMGIGNKMMKMATTTES
jgi:hypothetical protein